MRDKCKLCCTKIVDFSVKKDDLQILKDVNLHIHCGELTALIGPNGAGKTTLLKSIIGEVKHDGYIEFTGESEVMSRIPKIGYVPQYLEFDKTSPMSVRDLFASIHSKMPIFVKYPKDINEYTLESLRIVEAEHLIDRKIGFLSGGELQRVLLAFALTPMPEILLLDEPVSGVDKKGLDLFYKVVSDLRETYDLSIILISHDFNLVEKYADRVVLLNKTVKKIGKPKEVFKSKEFKEIF